MPASHVIDELSKKREANLDFVDKHMHLASSVRAKSYP